MDGSHKAHKPHGIRTPLFTRRCGEEKAWGGKAVPARRANLRHLLALVQTKVLIREECLVHLQGFPKAGVPVMFLECVHDAAFYERFRTLTKHFKHLLHV